MAKDKECLQCTKFFNCTGKEKGKACLHFKPRKEVKKEG